MNQQTETRGRRVVVSEFVTLDGFMVGPDEDMSWVAVGFDPQMQDDLAEDISGAFDLFVFGRVTYGIFADYWPHAVPYDEGDEPKPAEGKEDPRIIRALNERPKLVFSTTLEQPKWENTRVVAAGLEDEIRRLKQEPGGAMAIQGSASVVEALSRADLIDEYRLYVHPVLLGDGKQLFLGGKDRQDFELTKLTRYANGVIATTYERKDGARRMTSSTDTTTQYVVLIYERETPDWPNDIPPEIMRANEELDGRIAEQGGRVVAGVALQPNATATAIRSGVVTDGPFIETKEALAGLYILEARDLDHAIALARMTPTVDGGVEVRPLLGFQLVEPS